MSLLLAFVAFAAAADPSQVYAYRGPTAEGDRTAAEIVELVRAAPSATHLVRGEGAPDWLPWNQVPALAEVWMAGAPAPGKTSSPGDVPAPGAGGEPPRNAPPSDTVRPAPGAGRTSAPHAARSAPAPIVAAPVGSVRVGGDVRIDLLVPDLERLGAAGDPAPSTFVVSRARPILDVALGEWLTGRLAVEVRQDETSSTYTGLGTSVDVRDWADGWAIQGREIWLGAHGGEQLRHEVRVGLQEPAFGVRDTYEDTYPFAGEARADFGRRTGLIPEEDLGVGWRGELDAFAFDVQVLNGSGPVIDQNGGKDFVARVAYTKGILAISASGLVGARGPLSTGNQAQGALTVQVAGDHQRVLVEALAGATTEDRLDTLYSGAAVHGAWDVPLAKGALESVSVVGRAQYYDPVAGWDAPDGWFAYAGGLWVNWGVLPGQGVRTGATWEMYVPQDALLPIEHDVVAEVAWVF
jgi:hypothetical protein